MNILAVIRGHYHAAKEHIEANNIVYTPTWFDAVATTLHDLIYYKTITIDDSYVVYEVVKKRGMGLRAGLIISLYVPKHKRGNGIASRLLDAIPEKIVISDRGEHEEVGRLVICRKSV